MEKLDTTAILKEQRFLSRIFNGLVFTLIGVVASISPLIYLQSLDANTVIGIAVCVLCFGIPFGFLFGLRRLIPAIAQKKALSKGNFEIYVDVVKSTRMLSQGVKSEKGDYYCQIEFAKYSNVTGNYYAISRRMFNKTNDGDEFYLISLGNIKETIAIFPKKDYELSNGLQEKLVNK